MDKPIKEFAQQEFVTLREEIKELKARRFKVITGGVIATPVIFGIAEQLDITTVLLLVPLLVVATVLLEVSENNGIYRTGQYISEVIERYFIDSAWARDYPGWETWLEEGQQKEERRYADQTVNISFLIIFCVYYVAYASAGVVALDCTIETLHWAEYWKALTVSSVIFIYVIVFLHMLYFYYSKCRWHSGARPRKNL